jgi:hypothetical protein
VSLTIEVGLEMSDYQFYFHRIRDLTRDFVAISSLLKLVVVGEVKYMQVKIVIGYFWQISGNIDRETVFDCEPLGRVYYTNWGPSFFFHFAGLVCQDRTARAKCDIGTYRVSCLIDD